MEAVESARRARRRPAAVAGRGVMPFRAAGAGRIGRLFALAVGLGAAPLLPAQESSARAVPGQQASAAAPEQVEQFPGQVEQVTVDVVVTDEHGVPVRGLSAGDLVIFEDGARQTPVSFEAVDVAPAPSADPKPQPRVASNQDPEDSRGRSFVVLFDDAHLTVSMGQLAKAAIADFLTHAVREGDRVTLAASSGNAWWSTRMEAGRDELIALVKRLEGLYQPDTSRERMTDYEAMRIYLRRDTEIALRVQRRFEQFGVVLPSNNEPAQARNWATSIDSHLAQRAADVYFQTTPGNRVTLAALERCLEALYATKGRKSLILVSEGFIYDPNLEKEYERVMRAARRANTAIYFVNARGLEGMPEFMTAQFGPPLPERDLGFVFSEDLEVSEGAYSLASRSGGFTIRNTNDLSAGFQRIADENSSYYLLGYNPTNTARDGRFREIEVRVPGRKGVEVRARKGYYAPSDAPDADRRPGVDAVFQEALDSPTELGGIPLRMTHYVGDAGSHGSARVNVAVEVDLDALNLEEQAGRYVGGVEFVLVAAHRETGEYSRYDQKVEMKLLPESRQRMSKAGFPILREFDLEPGGYRAKIAVRDIGSDRVGTVMHEFEVPELGGFRVSTPILSDTLREDGDQAGQPVPVARRGFGRGRELFCQVEVYGAQRDAAGLPQVVMGYAVMGADGGAVAFAEPSLIRPTSIGHLSRLLRLETPPPGDYELVMAFRDMLGGSFLEVREPFSVLADEAREPSGAGAGR